MPHIPSEWARNYNTPYPSGLQGVTMAFGYTSSEFNRDETLIAGFWDLLKLYLDGGQIGEAVHSQYLTTAYGDCFHVESVGAHTPFLSVNEEGKNFLDSIRDSIQEERLINVEPAELVSLLQIAYHPGDYLARFARSERGTSAVNLVCRAWHWLGALSEKDIASVDKDFKSITPQGHLLLHTNLARLLTIFYPGCDSAPSEYGSITHSASRLASDIAVVKEYVGAWLEYSQWAIILAHLTKKAASAWAHYARHHPGLLANY